MGSNLSKAPLTAVLYAALVTFFTALMPFSAAMGEAAAAFSMPFVGYLFLFLSGLFLSAILGVLFYSARSQGVKFLLPTALSCLGIVSLQPLLEQIFRGEPSGVMTVGDSWLSVAASAVSVLLLLILGLLLFRNGEQEKVQHKYQLKKLPLLIKIVVSPFVFMALYFLTWYYAAWRNEAVRVYYQGVEAAADAGFVAELISMLLTQANVVTFALLQGLLYVLLSLPLVLQLTGKRTVFIACNTLLYLTGALCFLVPGPIMPDPVRTAHLVRCLVLLTLYGVFTGIMLHTSFKREAVEAPKEPAPPANKAKAAPGTMRR